MIMTVGRTVSKIGEGQRLEQLRHNEIDHNSLKYNLGPYTVFHKYRTPRLLS